MGLTNTHKACGFSVLYHVYAEKQCILRSSLCHKYCLTTLCFYHLKIHSTLELLHVAFVGSHLAALCLQIEFMRLLVGNETKYRQNNLY